jgi:hypothetical protein
MSQLLEDLLYVHKKVKKSWTRDTYFDPGGKVCAMGAIVRAVGLRADTFEVLDCRFEVPEWLDDFDRKRMARFEPRCERGKAVSKAIAAELPYRLGFGAPENVIPIWNDNPNTSKEDVLEVICKAIRKEAERVGASPVLEDVSQEVALEGPA